MRFESMIHNVVPPKTIYRTPRPFSRLILRPVFLMSRCLRLLSDASIPIHCTGSHLIPGLRLRSSSVRWSEREPHRVKGQRGLELGRPVPRE